jgi:hypothetical protein
MEVLVFGVSTIVSLGGFLYGLGNGKDEAKEAQGARVGWYGFTVAVLSGSVLTWHLL